MKTRAYLVWESPNGRKSHPGKDPLPNLSGVTLPISKFQVAGAAFIPAIIMVLIRPALLFITLLFAGAAGFAIHYLLHREAAALRMKVTGL